MRVNANDRLDLSGTCLSGCDNNKNQLVYNFKLYMFVFNQWTEFTNTSYYVKSQNDLTVKEELFQDFSSQIYWKIELSIFVPTRNTSGMTSIVFYINFPPRFGSCDINPKNLSSNSLLSISCSNWIDLDGTLSSYAFYGLFFKILLLLNKF
jgi:hypothetical protein